ncbi:hypothetical protein ES703_110815 [subsurface metagenome]
MEKDNVSFDAQVAQIPDPLFKVPKEFGIEATIIPVFQRFALKRVILRFVLVVSIGLGKDAHSHLIEWCFLQRGQRLLFHRNSLVDPGVAGRADLKISCAVGVCQVPGFVHANRPVVLR